MLNIHPVLSCFVEQNCMQNGIETMNEFTQLIGANPRQLEAFSDTIYALEGQFNQALDVNGANPDAEFFSVLRRIAAATCGTCFLQAWDSYIFPQIPLVLGIPPQFLHDPNLAAFTPIEILQCCQVARHTPNGIKQLVVVSENEHRLFFEIVYPLTRHLAGDRRIVLCHLPDPAIRIDAEDFPIIMIDAANTTTAGLRQFMRFESTANVFLKNRDNQLLIYFYNIGNTREAEKLSNLMPALLDGGFRPTKTTHILMTGAYRNTGIRNTGIRNFIDAGGMSRCLVCGVE